MKYSFNFFLIAFLYNCICINSSAQRPNVVFILADDLGVMDLGNEGSTFHETPNIDRIAAEGMKFTRGYATCQVCSPSRASIMTGKYPVRFPITDWINSSGGGQPDKWRKNTSHLPAAHRLELPLEEVTIAEALKYAGYSTFFAGKWHLGGKGFYPEDQGFDINKGGHERGSPPGGFFSPYKNPKLEDGPDGELLPLRLAEETAKFIEAKKDQPFFAMLSFYMVHAPDQTTYELYQKYRKKVLQQPEPKERFKNDVRIPVRQVQDNPIYGGMMESMDDAVGIVLNKLDALDISSNTIVIFTSDNGGVSAGDAYSTSNLPLRGGKGIEYEGGIREPYYIRWPAKVFPAVNKTPVTGTDFYPTILDACGLPLFPKQHLDGVSLLPILKGEEIEDRSIFWHYPHYSNQGGEPCSIIIDGDWKLIEDLEDGSHRLYNVRRDEGEQTDKAKDRPDLVKKLNAKLQAWKKETRARPMARNPKFDAEKFKQQAIHNHTKRKDSLEAFHKRLLHPTSELEKDKPVTYRSKAFSWK